MSVVASCHSQEPAQEPSQVFYSLVRWPNSSRVMKLGGGCLQHACLFSWIIPPLASVSHTEISIVILSILQQPSPALWLRFSPGRDTDGTTQLTQLEFMTSYCCGPPVRPSYSFHAGRCFWLHQPLRRPPVLKHSAIFSVYPWTGAWLQYQEVRQVKSRFLFGICERNCNRPAGRGRRVQLGMQMKGWEDDGTVLSLMQTFINIITGI